MYKFENHDKSIEITLSVSIPKMESTGFSLSPEEEAKYQLEQDMAIVKAWKAEMLKCLEKAEKDLTTKLSNILKEKDLQASPAGHMLYTAKTSFNIYEFNMTREALSDLQQEFYKDFLNCPDVLKETLKALSIYGFYIRDFKQGDFTYAELLHTLFNRL